MSGANKPHHYWDTELSAQAYTSIVAYLAAVNALVAEFSEVSAAAQSVLSPVLHLDDKTRTVTKEHIAAAITLTDRLESIGRELVNASSEHRKDLELFAKGELVVDDE